MKLHCCPAARRAAAAGAQVGKMRLQRMKALSQKCPVSYFYTCFVLSREMKILLISVLALMGAWLADMMLGKDSPASGVVIGRSHQPAYVIYTAGANGQQIPTMMPETYFLRVNGPHGQTSTSVAAIDYGTPLGVSWHYTETTGYFTGWVYTN
jgi:hypothetical protein